MGDPAEGGDIKLRLEANETVVSIEAGTKNLTLVKPLDKEVGYIFRGEMGVRSMIMTQFYSGCIWAGAGDHKDNLPTNRT